MRAEAGARPILKALPVERAAAGGLRHTSRVVVVHPQAVTRWGKLRYSGDARQWLCAEFRDASVGVFVQEDQDARVRDVLREIAAVTPRASARSDGFEGQSWGPRVSSPEDRIQAVLPDHVLEVLGVGAGTKQTMLLAWGPGARRRATYSRATEGWFARKGAPSVPPEVLDSLFARAQVRRVARLTQALIDLISSEESVTPPASVPQEPVASDVAILASGLARALSSRPDAKTRGGAKITRALEALARGDVTIALGQLAEIFGCRIADLRREESKSLRDRGWIGGSAPGTDWSRARSMWRLESLAGFVYPIEEDVCPGRLEGQVDLYDARIPGGALPARERTPEGAREDLRKVVEKALEIPVRLLPPGA